MQQREARRAESQGRWRGNACKARQRAPRESRKLARRGPRLGVQRGRDRGEEGGRGFELKVKRKGLKAGRSKEEGRGLKKEGREAQKEEGGRGLIGP
jgi:hypothetical protein